MNEIGIYHDLAPMYPIQWFSLSDWLFSHVPNVLNFTHLIEFITHISVLALLNISIKSSEDNSVSIMALGRVVALFFFWVYCLWRFYSDAFSGAFSSLDNFAIYLYLILYNKMFNAKLQLLCGSLYITIISLLDYVTKN